ncbi:YggT family protein [Metabacillus schmidteae]|uniref:YggT family protein n=1 Tax=Metabacillus schmidteae TaxID=2730405 RepID=UPI001589AA9A|nr:YggT family protein [Metabacillus schmidteae]
MGTLFSIINTLITFYSYALIVYILLSWFPGARESGFGQFLAKICEPYLEPFRKIIPPLGMIDISPIVAILALRFASYGVASIFSMIG